ncbi:hypothetical protein GN109_12620 [Collimonas pratensis]|uniref:hypothetical protein n=1 Tax=Collimonas pratensis TaxID=279113 RepID=UPI00143D69FC|nr:hypothetical protein [Collimonas pratensis]NKI70263.1 hypothetical protein [Collimonas pratensis]
MLTDKHILQNIERHRMQSDVSTQQYFHVLQNKLAGNITGKRRIYLDTKYWVLLRDAALGRPRAASHTEILILLRDLVSNGAVICPLSDAAYVESMQQTDKETRLATAALMDELSCGVAVATEATRVRKELLNFVAAPASDTSNFSDTIWVKTGFVLGENVPYAETLNADINLLAQKSFIDLLWNQTVADFAAQDHDRDLASLRTSAVNINEKMVAYADQIRSFEQAATAEFSGCVSLFDRKLTAAALIEKGLKNATTEEIDKFQGAMQRCLFNALRLRPDFMAKRVPTLFIHAMCHAAIRWDKQRKLDSHWLLDIHHACAGLAYHEAMFTEHPLRVLLVSGNMRMDQRFGACILSAEQDVLRYLAELTSFSITSAL